MQAMKAKLGLILALATSAPVMAQDLESQEIMVTANRIEQDDYQREMPSVGLRRAADFMVQRVAIRGDSRDPREREAEIRQMLRRAVQMADQNRVQLAFGSYILTRLTAQNVDGLALGNDNRPDSQRIDFLIKAPLSGADGVAAAQASIQRFIDAVPEAGRAQLDSMGDATLSVVGPDQYRLPIAERAMEDARNLANRMGPDYRVTIEGLNMPVQWAQVGLAEVFLFVPYKLVIVPKP
jgi:hypothetical protein